MFETSYVNNIGCEERPTSTQHDDDVMMAWFRASFFLGLFSCPPTLYTSTRPHRPHTATDAHPTHTHNPNRLQASARAEKPSKGTLQVNPSKASIIASSAAQQAKQTHSMTMEETSLEQRRAGYVGRGLAVK